VSRKIPLDKKEAFQKVNDETLNVELSPMEAVEKAKGSCIGGCACAVSVGV